MTMPAEKVAQNQAFEEYGRRKREIITGETDAARQVLSSKPNSRREMPGSNSHAAQIQQPKLKIACGPFAEALGWVRDLMPPRTVFV
jgi:hypothetical protein